MRNRKMDGFHTIILAVCCLVVSSVVLADTNVFYDVTGSTHYNGLSMAIAGEEAQGDDFRVVLKGEKEADTAWRVTSERIAVEPDAAYVAFDFDIYSDADWRTKLHNSAAWSCGLAWYDGNGGVLKAPAWIDALGVRHDSEYFNPQFLPKQISHFRIVGEVPNGAVSLTISFGRDTPNLKYGERVSVSHSKVSFFSRGAPRPQPASPDLKGPVVIRSFVSPNDDPHVPVRFRVLDETAVDWNSLWVGPIGPNQMPFQVSREGDVVTVAPGREWPMGDHHLCVSVKDVLGNKTTVPKAFRIGSKPTVPGTCLREDGVLTVGGRSFFPIGLFAICPREANLYSLDRAFSDLRTAGVNLAHSYTHYRTPEFAACCAKFGMISFQAEHNAAEGSKWFESTARQDPTVGLWYVGDDTSMHCEPEGIANRVEALGALDGTRLTCHADVYNSRFGEYADLVDVFMPEIYPIFGGAEDKMCVARVIDVMEKSLSDIRSRSTGRPRAVWPIIQYFKGYTAWKRMPTPKEVEAMSFAAIIHGAKGLTWYTYGGFVNPEKKSFNYGVCSSAETWSSTTNLTRRLSILSPIFISGDVPQPNMPEVISGPAHDSFNRVSVSVLLKVYNNRRYIFAVNAADQKVRVRIHTGLADELEGSVLGSTGKVKNHSGSFEDEFAPFEVRIYRF